MEIGYRHDRHGIRRADRSVRKRKHSLIAWRIRAKRFGHLAGCFSVRLNSQLSIPFRRGEVTKKS
jgi:hypothetical protein